MNIRDTTSPPKLLQKQTSTSIKAYEGGDNNLEVTSKVFKRKSGVSYFLLSNLNYAYT